MTIFKKQIKHIDETIVQLKSRGLFTLAVLFILLAAISSREELFLLIKTYTNTVQTDKATITAKEQLESSKKELEKLTAKLPYSNMFTLTNDANRYLLQKIENFNKNNPFNLSASTSSECSCDGIKPYFVAKIKFANTNSVNIIAALIYFEKIGYIESFENNELVLYMEPKNFNQEGEEIQ